jgi:hypothetical protein
MLKAISDNTREHENCNAKTLNLLYFLCSACKKISARKPHNLLLPIFGKQFRDGCMHLPWSFEDLLFV